MARKKRPEPTDAELRLLHPLWNHGPMRLSELCDRLAQEGSPLATTTVATVLRVMREKGFVKRRSLKGQVTWAAAEDRSTTSNRFLKGLTQRLFDGSTKNLISHLVKEGDLSATERAEIRELLTQIRKDDEPLDT